MAERDGEGDWPRPAQHADDRVAQAGHHVPEDQTRLHESVQHAGDGAACRASSRRLRDWVNVADAAGRYDQPVTNDELLAHCLSKPGAWQDEPWEGDTVVKVGPKIFAFLGSGDGAATHGSVGVKCAANRDAADEWLKL